MYACVRVCVSVCECVWVCGVSVCVLVRVCCVLEMPPYRVVLFNTGIGKHTQHCVSVCVYVYVCVRVCVCV